MVYAWSLAGRVSVEMYSARSMHTPGGRTAQGFPLKRSMLVTALKSKSMVPVEYNVVL